MLSCPGYVGCVVVVPESVLNALLLPLCVCAVAHPLPPPPISIHPHSPVVRAETLRFKEEGVFRVVKDVFLPWYNAYRCV